MKPASGIAGWAVQAVSIAEASYVASAAASAAGS